MGEQLVILPDRTDVGLLDLVGVGHLTAVTNQDGARELLLEGQAKVLLHPGNDVERGDVEDIVTVNLRLVVNGRRLGLPVGDLVDDVLLAAGLDITLGPQVVSSQVGPLGLDAREGTVLGALENLGNPRVLAHDALRLRVQVGGVREQQLRVLDTVVRGVSQNRGTERHAGLTSLSEDLLLIGVREVRTHKGTSVSLEDVGMHQSITPEVAVFGVLIVVFVVIVLIELFVLVEVLILAVNVTADLLDKGCNSQTLVIVEGLEDIGDREVVLVVNLVFVHGFCVLRCFSGIVRERETGINDGLILGLGP